MKRIIVLFAFCCAASFCYAQHPRLFFDSTEAISIKNRALVPGSTENKLFLEIKELADRFVASPQDMWDWGDGRTPMRHWNLYALGFAYFVTQQSIYLEKTRLIINMFFGHPYPAGNTNMVAGLAQTVDLLWNDFSPGLRDSIFLHIIRGLIGNPGASRDYFALPQIIHDNNHMGSQGMGLLSAAIVFNGNPAYPEANSDIDLVRHAIITYPYNLIVRMNHADGSTPEGVYYPGYNTPLLHMLGRWDAVNYIAQFQSRFADAGKYLAYEVLPAPRNPFSRYFNPINDSYRGFENTNGVLVSLHQLSSVYQDGIAKWVFNNTVEDVANLVNYALDHAPTHNSARAFAFVEALAFNNETPPTDPSGLPKSKYFPNRQLYYIRTSNSWADNNDVQFSLTASPAIDYSLNPPNGVFSVKHNQPDKNSVTLSAFGQDFIVDIGYGGQLPEDQNYILIDGRGQSPAAINGGVNAGRIVETAASNGFDFIHGDAKNAFDTYYYHGPNGVAVPVVDPTNTVQNADRYVLFTRASGSAGHMFVVADDINRNNQNHQYKWIFNTNFSCASGSWPLTIDQGGKQLRLWYTGGATPQVGCSIKYRESSASDSPVNTWGQYGQNEIIVNSINPYFHVAMIPFDAGDPEPLNVTTFPLSIGSCIKFTWPGYEDYSVFKYSSPISSPLVNTDGKLNQIRKSLTNGLPLNFAMAEGTALHFEDRDLVDLFGQQGTVFREGSAVSINGNVEYFQIYCPSATSVKVNGSDVAFVQVGDYVEPTHVTIPRTWSGNITSAYDIVVDAGVTLTLAAASTMTMSGRIQVDGALIANGTSSPITMTSNGVGGGITSSTSTSSLLLTAVNISNAQTAINASAESNLQVRYCTFNACDVGINIYAAPFGQTPQMEISNNTFSNFNLNCTGVAIAGTSNVLLTSNVLSGRREKGVGVFLSASSPQMQQNAIENWKRGIVCVNGSSPSLEQGYNIISGNKIGILCDNSDAALSLDQGENDICLNDIDVTLVKSKTFVIKNRWRFDENPPGIFEIDGSSTLEYNPWSPPTPNCGGLSPIAGNGKEQIEGGSMSLLSPLVRQIFRERSRGNFAIAEGLIRSAINNRNVPDDVKLWALGQMLAVGQRRRNGNLASFFNSPTSTPALARKARALLPMSFAHEGSFAQAMAAYDANVRDYPNSSEARAGLYGRFSYHLFNRRDTTQARALLNRLAREYPQSIEKEIAELQMSSFRLSSSPSSSLTGGIAKGASGTSATSTLQSIPAEFALSQNYPNPFNPTTTISYDVPVSSHVTIKLFDVLGRGVQTLVDEFVKAGYRQVALDAGSLPSGLYFYRMQSDKFVKTRKAVVLK